MATSGPPIWINAETPINDLVPYLDTELVRLQITSIVHHDLLKDVSDGPHVGVLHVVLHHHAWFAVGEGPRRHHKYKCNGSGNENHCYGKGKNVGVVGVDVDDRMEEESFNNQFRCLFGDF